MIFDQFLYFSCTFHTVHGIFVWSSSAFRCCYVLTCLSDWEQSRGPLTYRLLFSGPLRVTAYRTLFSFSPSRYPSVSIAFYCPLYIYCWCGCASRDVCVPARPCTHHLHACVRETRYYQRGSLVQRETKEWYPELRHQTPEASWVMVHRSTARTKAAMVKGDGNGGRKR